jgi:hypothetical protein
LGRQLSLIRLRETRTQKDEGAVARFTQFADGFSSAVEPLNALVSETTDQAIALRDALIAAAGHSSPIENQSEDEASPAAPIDQGMAMRTLLSATPQFEQIADSMKAKTDNLLSAPPQLTSGPARQSFEKWKARTRLSLPSSRASQQLQSWDPTKPGFRLPRDHDISFGTNWMTASFWQDWMRIIPLLAGSIMVAAVALLFAVPLGGVGRDYVSAK